MNGRRMIHAYHKADFGFEYVAKDLIVPNLPKELRAKELFNELDQIWGHYPVHLCPSTMVNTHPNGLLIPRSWTSFPEGTNTGINIGVYGPGPPSRDKILERIEQMVASYDGIGWIYSIRFYDESSL